MKDLPAGAERERERKSCRFLLSVQSRIFLNSSEESKKTEKIELRLKKVARTRFLPDDVSFSEAGPERGAIMRSGREGSGFGFTSEAWPRWAKV